MRLSFLKPLQETGNTNMDLWIGVSNSCKNRTSKWEWDYLDMSFVDEQFCKHQNNHVHTSHTPHIPHTPHTPHPTYVVACIRSITPHSGGFRGGGQGGPGGGGMVSAQYLREARRGGESLGRLANNFGRGGK